MEHADVRSHSKTAILATSQNPTPPNFCFLKSLNLVVGTMVMTFSDGEKNATSKNASPSWTQLEKPFLLTHVHMGPVQQTMVGKIQRPDTTLS